MNLKNFSIAAVVSAVLAIPAGAAQITPDIIWGSGNSNRGFTVETFGDLELGLRAKRRYTSPSDAIGDGIVQDSNGNYLFDSTGHSVPANRSIWNFDWAINSNITDGSTSLDTYTYQIGVDYDPSANENMQTYNPLSMIGTGYYLGDNNTGNGASTYTPAILHPLSNLSDYNVAQNSVNMGFLTGAPIGAGQYKITLSAFNGSSLVGSTSINVYVDSLPAAVPLPAGALLLPVGLGGLALLRRRKRNHS